MATGVRDLAPAVTRAIRILQALATTARPVKTGELASLLDLPKSSVHGVCSSLLAGGLIERTESGEYVLGMRLLDFASARLAQYDLAQDFIRIWTRHPQFAHDAAVLSELNGIHVVYLACRNSVHPLGVTFRVGMRMPAAVTATGKALLSVLPEAEIDRMYRRKSALEPQTVHSVRSVTALKAQLREIRRTGYSIDDGETREGMISVGAPVFDRGRTGAVAGIALSFFRGELNPRREKQAIAAVKDVAELLSERAVGLGTLSR